MNHLQNSVAAEVTRLKLAPSPVSGRDLCCQTTTKSPPSSGGAAYLRHRAATFPRPRSAPVPGGSKIQTTADVGMAIHGTSGRPVLLPFAYFAYFAVQITRPTFAILAFFAVTSPRLDFRRRHRAN